MTDKEIIINGVDVSECKHHRKCILPDNIGCKIDDFLCCDKPNCNYKQLVRKTQIIDEVEEVIKPYQEQIELDALSLPIAIESILERKTQECENLKAEEKYLKQCCQKAGEELAKHSFEYDGKEKNLVVQAIELNEKYEKFKKALEEIEEVIDSIFDRCPWRKTDSCMPVYNVCEELIKTLDIINKAKGGNNDR